MREKQKKIIQWSSLALILLTGIIVWRVNYEIDFMENQIFELISKIYAKINNLWLNQRLLFCKKIINIYNKYF